MKIIKALTAALFFIFVLTSNVFASGVQFDGDVPTTAKGKEITGSSITIKITPTEVEPMKDSITISLNGAKWRDLKASGKFSAGVAYEKLSDEKIALHITPTENMLNKGFSVKIPLNCKITKDINYVQAIVDWGLPEYSQNTMTIARCEYSHAWLNGDIKEHKKGDKIYLEGGRVTYNELKIYVIGHDSEKTRNKIKVTLDGATWSDYEKTGPVANNRYADIIYRKTDEHTIEIQINDFNLDLQQRGYTMTFPLTGTITGTGDIKAVVDFGTEDIEPNYITFARCPSGTLMLSSADPESPVDERSQVADVTIIDTTTQGYKRNTKFELKLNLSYNFTEVPKLECSEKFDGKCRIEISKTSTKKCIITITENIEDGSEGTITIKSPIIERPAINVPNVSEIKMTLTAKGWEDYKHTTQIGRYTPESEVYQPAIQISTTSSRAAANGQYAFLNKITFNDISSNTYKKDDKIVMRFDKGFIPFADGAVPKIECSGKFDKKCVFEFSPEHPEEAYIVFTDNITGESGSIDLTGMVLEKTTDETFETVDLTAGIAGDNAERFNTIQVAAYSSTLTRTPVVTKTQDKKKITADGQSAVLGAVILKSDKLMQVHDTICSVIQNK